MTDMYWAGKYKSKIINLLLNSEDTITLINPTIDDRFDIQDILLGGEFEIQTDENITELVRLQGNIFDYYYIPNTTTESKTFVCVETEVEDINTDLITEFNMYIYVFTLKDNVRLTEKSTPTKTEMAIKKYAGNRVDMLSDSVDRILRGDSTFGIGDVRRSKRGYSRLSAPTTDFYGRRMSYTVKNFTEDEGASYGN